MGFKLMVVKIKSIAAFILKVIIEIPRIHTELQM
jgi:hypothetical protein